MPCRGCCLGTGSYDLRIMKQKFLKKLLLGEVFHKGFEYAYSSLLLQIALLKIAL